MDVSRLHRVLKLLTILQSGDSPSTGDLVEELGVSRRTLFRDLNILEAAGIPYFHENDKGYRLSPSFFLPPVNLKVTEAMGLMTLAKSAAAQSDQPLANEAVQAIRKLIAQVPGPIREVCSDMMVNTSVKHGATALVNGDSDHYADLQHAIDDRRVVTMHYHSLYEGGDIDVALDPYHLHYAVRTWYVIGRCKANDDIRTYKLARIHDLTITEHHFRANRRFCIDEYLGKAWQMIPEGKMYRVELEFEPMVAHNVAEVRWHDTQRHEMLPDGRCRMSFEIDGLNEISWWLMGYGDQVRVIKPIALRKRLVDTYRNALAKYESTNGQTAKSAGKNAGKSAGNGQAKR